MPFLSAQHSLLGVHFISRWHFCKPQKVDTVNNWPVSMTAKEFHSFLGLASYYCCFIPKFTVISKCLHNLVGPNKVKRKTMKEPEVTTDSNRKFNYTGKHQEAFDLLKSHLMSAQVMGYPDFQDLLI